MRTSPCLTSTCNGCGAISTVAKYNYKSMRSGSSCKVIVSMLYGAICNSIAFARFMNRTIMRPKRAIQRLGELRLSSRMNRQTLRKNEEPPPTVATRRSRSRRRLKRLQDVSANSTDGASLNAQRLASVTSRPRRSSSRHWPANASALGWRAPRKLWVTRNDPLVNSSNRRIPVE